MASVVRIVQSCSINNLLKSLTNLSLSCAATQTTVLPFRPAVQQYALLHSTRRNCDLMEFFDKKTNWGEDEVKVGRSWRMDELRIKSNEDLHKLWFVLLKERNMLMTLEAAAKDQFQIFPSPERLNKVQDSMDNLELVVRERNKAYHLLETGETGERPTAIRNGPVAIKYCYKMSEHLIPRFMNTSFKKKYIFHHGGNAVTKFKKYYREKLWLEKRKAKNRELGHVRRVIRKFPNPDYDALKQMYPDLNVDAVRRDEENAGRIAPLAHIKDIKA